MGKVQKGRIGGTFLVVRKDQAAIIMHALADETADEKHILVSERMQYKRSYKNSFLKKALSKYQIKK